MSEKYGFWTILTTLVMTLVVGGFIGAWLNEPQVTYPTADEIASKTASLVTYPAVPTADEIASKVVIPSVDNNLLQEVKDKLFEEDIKDSDALKIAKDEFGRKTVRQDIQELLNALTHEDGTEIDIEEWNDLQVLFTDEDVLDADYDEDNYEVELKLKVTYYENGDEDDDNHAHVKATVTIEDGEVEDIEYETIRVH